MKKEVECVQNEWQREEAEGGEQGRDHKIGVGHMRLTLTRLVLTISHLNLFLGVIGRRGQPMKVRMVVK